MLLDKMSGNRLLFWGIENVMHFCIIMSFRVGIRITDIYSRRLYVILDFLYSET